MSMNVKIKASMLKDAVKQMSALTDEAVVVFDESGMDAKIVDAAHVAMLHLYIRKKEFEAYDVDGKKELFVPLDKLTEVCKLANSTDVVDITMDEEKNSLKLVFSNLTRSMSLLNQTDAKSPKVPKLEAKATIGISKENLTLSTKSASQITDHLKIEADADGINFSASGEVDKVMVNISKDQLDKHEIKEPCKSLYSLDYFSQILGVMASDTVTLEFGTDFPITISFEQNGIKSMFLLAPRIEDA